MKEKMAQISKVENDLKYLREEYANNILWGSAPDGNVKFETLIEWLAENEHTVAYMLTTSMALKAI